MKHFTVTPNVKKSASTSTTGTGAIVQNKGNTHIQAWRSGVETTQPSVCAPHMYPFYYVAAGLGGSNHPSNVARRFAFETMTPRTARDAHSF